MTNLDTTTPSRSRKALPSTPRRRARGQVPAKKTGAFGTTAGSNRDKLFGLLLSLKGKPATLAAICRAVYGKEDGPVTGVILGCMDVAKEHGRTVVKKGEGKAATYALTGGRKS